MIKKILSIVAACLFGSLCLAQDAPYQYVSEYGFTYKVAVTNNHTWTNDNFYPFKISALQFNSDIANTTTVVRVRPSVTYQVIGTTITTNAFHGLVDSNYFAQVTNTVTVSLTNILLSVTNSGSLIYGISDIPQQYVLPGDILQFNFSDNTSKLLIFDAIR